MNLNEIFQKFSESCLEISLGYNIKEANDWLLDFSTNQNCLSFCLQYLSSSSSFSSSSFENNKRKQNEIFFSINLLHKNLQYNNNNNNNKQYDLNELNMIKKVLFLSLLCFSFLSYYYYDYS